MRLVSICFTVFAATCPLVASVTITSFKPSLDSPQKVGTPVIFTASAHDTGSGPLAFQFNVSFDGGAYATVQDFRGYPLQSDKAADTFLWGAALTEGTYSIQLIAKDFVTGQSATETFTYTRDPIASGPDVVLTATTNPLVVLASGPSCPFGSSFEVSYQIVTPVKSNVYKTSPLLCDGVHTMNQYVAGLYSDYTYSMNYRVVTGADSVVGPVTVSLTIGALPAGLIFPSTTLITAAGLGSDPTTKDILWGTFGGNSKTALFLPMMTDLSGTVLWYYAVPDTLKNAVVSRFIPGGKVMTIQDGNVWNGEGDLGQGADSIGQVDQINDAAGNVVVSTSTQAVAEALTAAGYKGTTHCSTVPLPAAIGTRCLASFNHDFLQLPDGNYLALVEQEAIFAPGTQGGTSMCSVSGSSVPCNVEIVANSIVVLNSTTLQPLWFWSAFDHDGASEIPITRPAIYLGAASNTTCSDSGGGCSPIWLAGTTGVSSVANDWLHLNSAFYRASDGNLIISMRHQDWAALVQYQNATGNGDVLWRLGCSRGLSPPVTPVCGDFTFNNVYGDVYPWFSHQHDVEIDANGYMTMYDNGNTRVYELGNDQNSRGYVINVDEVNKTVTPILIQNLGYQSNALGSAQLLPSGDYFFQASDIVYASGLKVVGGPTHGLEVEPTTGESGNIVYDLETTTSYRAFALPNFYDYVSPQ